MHRPTHVNRLTATVVAVAGALGIVLLPVESRAAYTLDRWFQMGDDSLFNGTGQAENAANGDEVGSNASGAQAGLGLTYDSSAVDDATFQSLTATGPLGNGLPRYAEYGQTGNPAAPVSGAASMNGFGVRFDGVDDYLFGVPLNDPSISAPGSTVVFPGTSDRGFQLWVYPEDVDGTKEFILDDADEHGINITTGGEWQAEVRDDTQDPASTASNGLPSPTNGQWAHIMVVHDSLGVGGAASWVDGRALASMDLDYDSGNSTNLLVGANAEDSGGTTADPATLGNPGFFTGIIDEIEMFVIDDGATYGEFDYTEDNGYFTDVFLPTTTGYGFTLDTATGHNSQTWVEGDINFDGVFDTGDIAAFVTGWLSTNGDIAGGGGNIGDFVTLGLGDLDLDGDTDLSDWVVLRQLSSAASIQLPSLGQLLAAPEPSTSAMALIALAGALARGRATRPGHREKK